MQLFLQNILIRILHHPDLLNMGLTYDLITTYRPKVLTSFPGNGNILIRTKPNQLKQLLDEISQIYYEKPKSITILINNTTDVSKLLQQYFKLMKAAGGIVTKEDQILMIYRANIWDLPKGRIEQGESTLTAAIREVNEECGVKAIAKNEFYTTWHAFQTNHINVLKETTWYVMECIDDTHMAPQKEEAIEHVAWIDTMQLQPILENTYVSIRSLLQAYQNHKFF